MALISIVIGEASRAEAKVNLTATSLQAGDIGVRVDMGPLFPHRTKVVVRGNQARRELASYVVKEGECSIAGARFGGELIQVGESFELMSYAKSGIFFFRRTSGEPSLSPYDLTIGCGGQTGLLDAHTAERLNSVLGNLIRLK
jgi:hypothetical protein